LEKPDHYLTNHKDPQALLDNGKKGNTNDPRDQKRAIRKQTTRSKVQSCPENQTRDTGKRSVLGGSLNQKKVNLHFKKR